MLSKPERDQEIKSKPKHKSLQDSQQTSRSAPDYTSQVDIFVPGLFQSKYGINPWDDDWDDGM